MSHDNILLALNFALSTVVGTGIVALVQHFTGDGPVDWLYAGAVGLALGLGNSWRLYRRWRQADSQAPVSKH